MHDVVLHTHSVYVYSINQFTLLLTASIYNNNNNQVKYEQEAITYFFFFSFLMLLTLFALRVAGWLMLMNYELLIERIIFYCVALKLNIDWIQFFHRFSLSTDD